MNRFSLLLFGWLSTSACVCCDVNGTLVSQVFQLMRYSQVLATEGLEPAPASHTAALGATLLIITTRLLIEHLPLAEEGRSLAYLRYKKPMDAKTDRTQERYCCCLPIEIDITYAKQT